MVAIIATLIDLISCVAVVILLVDSIVAMRIVRWVLDTEPQFQKHRRRVTMGWDGGSNIYELSTERK